MAAENKMGVMPVGRLLVNMSIPLMASLLVQSLYNIVDSMFVGRLSEDALTATSLAYPIQVLMITVSVGTAIGVNSELARLIGKKDDQGVSRVAVTGLVLTTAASIIFVLVGALFAPVIASAMTNDTEISSLCSQYLQICMVLCSGTFFEMMFQRFLQASGKTMLSMVSLIVGAGTNIILDPILIFGYFGAPSLGIRGAAIATVIGQWLGALVACLLSTFCNPEVKVRFRGWRLDGRTVGNIYRIGFPTMVTNGIPSVMLVVMNAILMPYSSTAVAFFGVYYKLQNFLLMPMNGMGQACLPIIAYNYGRGTLSRIRKVLQDSIPAAAIIALIITAVFLAFPRLLLSFFSASAEMMSIGIPGLRIISVTFPLASVSVVLGYCMSGLGNGVIMMIGTLIRQFVLLIPVAYLLLSMFGIQTTWYAFWPAELVAVVFMALASLWKYRSVARSLTNP